ncbi:MAG: hypothetical protein FWG26_10665 [Betaproteobacteria bacterium]|jgi:hypothetical protein|nr:hypothetical protein [Betaproteobacteria bacterium]
MPPHPLTVRLRPSPILLAVVLAAHLVGAVALFLMSLPLKATIPLVLLLLVSAVQSVRAQARKRGLSLVLAADGALRICREGGDDGAWGRVLPGAVLFPAVSWLSLAWTARGGRPERMRLMLIASEVIEENCGGNAQWRRLRTWLRYRALDSDPEAFSPVDVA